MGKNWIKQIHENRTAFTLVEILMAIFIVGVLAAYILPGITNGVKMIREAGQRNADILRIEGEVQKSISEKIVYQGVEIPIKFESKDEVKSIQGGLVVQEPIITFIPDLAYINLKPSFIDEGYSRTNILLTGHDTHFDANSTLEIRDKEDNIISNSFFSSFTINDTISADFTLETGLTNAQSPYTVIVETPRDESLEVEEAEIVRAKFKVNLPQFIAVGTEGDTLVSATGEYWVEREAYAAVDFNDITSGKEKFIAVGQKGIINLLEDQKDWKQIDTGNKDIFAIEYNPVSEEFVAVGEGGIILISSDGVNWRNIQAQPLYRKEVNELNKQPAVYFNGLNTRMVSKKVPVTGSQERSVFMVIMPEAGADLLLDWGSSAEEVRGGRWTLRLDRGDEGNLSIEIDDEAYFKSNLIPLPETASIVGAVLKGNKLGDHILYLNGDYEDINSPGVEVANESQAVNTQNNNYLNLGDYAWRNLPFKGYLAEVLIYERVLSSAEIDKLNKYLADKYGITELHYQGDEPAAGEVPANPSLWLKADTLTELNSGQGVSQWLDTSSIGNDLLTGGKSLYGAYYLGSSSGDSRDDLLLLVGEQGMVMLRDKGHWQLGTANTLVRLNSISRGSNSLLAVGNQGTILSSLDGQSWREIEIEESNNFNDVLWSDNLAKFIAVTAGGKIYTSDNGEHWSLVYSGSTELNSLTEYIQGGESTLLVVGNSSPNVSILMSKNGVNWSFIDQSIICGDLRGVTVKRY